jgi:hypothetical protein
MTTCARNLPQHFNGCACTAVPGGVTAEAADVDLTSAYPGGMSEPAPYSFGDSIPEQEAKYDVKIEPLMDDEGQSYLRVSYGEGHKESLNLDSEAFDRVLDSVNSHLPPPEPHHNDYALYEWMEDAKYRTQPTAPATAPVQSADNNPYAEAETEFDMKIEPLIDDEGQDYLHINYGEGGKESINLGHDDFHRLTDVLTRHSPPPEPHHYDYALYEWMEDARYRR